MSAMTKKEWMEYLEKTWDAAQKEAWSEPQFECPRCGHCCQSDMSLRDYFAGKAMQALAQGNYFDATARQAYMIADAMLREREK